MDHERREGDLSRENGGNSVENRKNRKREREHVIYSMTKKNRSDMWW